jgi:DNA-binding TFAR19-related protein (PDSD5 family)
MTLLSHDAFLFAVNSIAMVKPEKAQSVEKILIRMAQTGQIQGKVN